MSQPSPSKMLKTSNPVRGGPLKEICVNKMRDRKGILEQPFINSPVIKPLKTLYPNVSLKKCMVTISDVNKVATKVTNVMAAQKENYPNIQKHSPKKTTLGSELTSSCTKILRLKANENIQLSATSNVIKIKTECEDKNELSGTVSELATRQGGGKTIVSNDVVVKSELQVTNMNLIPNMLIDEHKRVTQLQSNSMSTPKSSRMILADGTIPCRPALTFRNDETSIDSTNSSNKIPAMEANNRSNLDTPLTITHETAQTPISITLADHSATVLPMTQSSAQSVSLLVSKSDDPETTVSSPLPEVSTFIDRSSPTITNGTTSSSVPSNNSRSITETPTSSISTNLPPSTPNYQISNASFLSSTPASESPFYANRTDSHSSFLQTTPNCNSSFLSTTPSSSTSTPSTVFSSPVSPSSSFEEDISSPSRSGLTVESRGSLEPVIRDAEAVASDILCSPAAGCGGVVRTTPSAPPLTRRNARERNRVRQVSQGFAILRQHVPQASRRKKLSKVETLRCAVDYIRALSKMVEENNDNNNASSITSSSSSSGSMATSFSSSSTLSCSLQVKSPGGLDVKTLNYPFSYALQNHPQLLQPIHQQTSLDYRQQEQQVNPDYHQQQQHQQQHQQQQTQQTLLSMASSCLMNAPVISKQEEQRGPEIVASEQRGVHTTPTPAPTPAAAHTLSVGDVSSLFGIDPLVFKLPGADKNRITEEYVRYARYADVVFNPTPDTSSDFSGTSSLGLTPGGCSASSSFSLDLSNISSPSQGLGSSSFGLSDLSSPSESPTTDFMKSTTFGMRETSPTVLPSLGHLKSMNSVGVSSSVGIPCSSSAAVASSSQPHSSSPSVSMMVHTGDTINDSSSQDLLEGDDTDQESELMDCLSWWQEAP